MNYPNNQQYPYQQPYQDPNVSVKEWVGTIIISCIPVVGFIMMLVWAFSSGTKPSKANYCKAYFLISIILAVATVFFSILGFAGLVSLLESYS